MKMKLPFFIILLLFHHGASTSVVPVLTLDQQRNSSNSSDKEPLKFLPFIMLIDKDRDTSEYWRETEILSLVRNNEVDIDYEKCEQSEIQSSLVYIPSRRTVRPVCRSTMDYQLCPQCPRLSNITECELFRDSCRERRVRPPEYRTYCDRKYGKWRSMFIPADYDQCRCCDECVFYRELDQSCMQDEYNFDSEEFLPVTTIDFRAGCNPYWGHPEQEMKALRCDRILRRCVPVTMPPLPNESLSVRRNFRFQPPTGGASCPVSCRGYDCHGGLMQENQCAPGAFLPDKDECNCCGKCSAYQQLNEKCAEYKKTVHNVNGARETEMDIWATVICTIRWIARSFAISTIAFAIIIKSTLKVVKLKSAAHLIIEEEFLEPGCDDGLVCRQGYCQDIHAVHSSVAGRRKRDEALENDYEPCKREMKYFKKKYGVDGHLHYEAPQCTPLWLYAPVQCRRFVCYCALEDGTFIEGIKVPRVEVSNMNCDCAREKCRTGAEVECDGYGNYKQAVFTMLSEEWEVGDQNYLASTTSASSQRVAYENPLPTTPVS